MKIALPVAVGAIALLFVLAVWQPDEYTKSESRRNMASARILGLACRGYAADHGAWPARLDELTPEYLTPEELSMFQFILSDGSPRLDWTYTPPASFKPDGDAILLASPSSEEDYRIEYRENGEGRIIAD